MSIINRGFGGIPEITKNLMIINGIVFLATLIIPGLRESLSLHYFSNEAFRPWQIVTHMFNHATFFHIFFNMFTLYNFGVMLERVLGPKRFLTFYLFTGFGGAFLHLFVDVIQVYHATGTVWLDYGNLVNQQMKTIYNSQMLGASGAVFGVLTAFGIMYPEARIMLLFPPIPLKAKVFIPILILMELSLGIGNWDNVAHFAHLGGALFGYILLKIWNKNNNFFI